MPSLQVYPVGVACTCREEHTAHFLLNSYMSSAYLQMTEVCYLIYRRRYFYPVLVLFMFTVSVTALTRALLRTRKTMRALMNEVRLTPVVVGGWVRGVSSHKLLPGDVLVLQPGKALFDMVVLQGNCLCVESMLSGEVRAFLWLLCHPPLLAITVCVAAARI